MVSDPETEIRQIAFNFCFPFQLAALQVGVLRHRRDDVPGRAVQVDPIRPTLKPTGTKRLKLNCDVLLSTSAFEFNLRRYSLECDDRGCCVCSTACHGKVGRCRLTLSHPR
jgi:hypothetical protein